ncbi:TonB-dependent receptor [Hyphomicrobium sp. CS1GBMeth3]|uniref:TonB-dependent receptor family protein n=1 Tax=Hyphomicrobium sp. CS1GBMeth3 TaxID=1892845 RepID=UPI0009F90A09|nr:TonB-dependent receptor [Hyphomicrobium sp. CS1GBMeth3]
MSLFLRPLGSPRATRTTHHACFAVSLLALTAVLSSAASAQEAPVELPEVNVTTTTPQLKAKAKPQTKAAPAPQPVAPAAVATDSNAGAPSPGDRSGSLSVPTTAEATVDIDRTPGAVEVVPDTAYKTSTPAVTIKDALDYVPGVFVQPKWGEDSRISIRGSSLSRNFHLRGIQLYMDGIPINTADGYGDFQEIDPTAYRYIEVFKGANALRFGANALGGAINFVMPTGYDADLFGARVDIGSFGFRKLAVSSGAVSGPVDYFMTGTWQEADGFRDHSDGESVRGSMNVGYRLSENVETRFYVNANDVDQRIPGSVTKRVALTSPETANPGNITGDYQRNIETVRIANKTAIRLMPGTVLEVGAFNVDRHLMHPIFQWLDNRYDDYGGFARITDESRIGGFANRLIAGVNLHNGSVDVRQYQNLAGQKGDETVATKDTSHNLSAYFENHFYVTPQVALVAGTQFLHATRKRDVDFGATPGETEFNLWSPKGGVVWDVTRTWQVFGNISRSAEVPSFGESVVGGSINIPFFELKPQRATTYEIGTRGGTDDFRWDFALYRANIDNELLCFTTNTNPSTCQVGNADKTIHQGVELGFGAAVLKSLFARGPDPDKVWLHAAYTFSDFRYDGDAEWGNNELPGAPRHFLRAELLYKHPSGIYFGPNVEWVPEAYYVDSANSFETDAYAIWGAKIGFDNGGPITAYLEGRNLSDEAYIASTSIAADMNGSDALMFEPGTGRAIYGGVQVKW